MLPAVQRVTIALSLCQGDPLSCLLPASVKGWLGKTLDHPQSLARDTRPRSHSRELRRRLPSCAAAGSAVGAAAMKNSMEDPQQTKNAVAI